MIYETAGKYLEIVTAIVYGLCLQYFFHAFLKKESSFNFEIQQKDNLNCFSRYRCYFKLFAVLIFILWEIFGKSFLEQNSKGKSVFLEQLGYLAVSIIIVFFIARGIFYFQSRLAVFLTVTFSPFTSPATVLRSFISGVPS